MANQTKYNQILAALQTLLAKKNIQTISVSEIAQTTGIGKGSIYYYIPSISAILEALIVRSYQPSLMTAHQLTQQKDISPFTRMAQILQACRDASRDFLSKDSQVSPLDE